MLSDSENEDLTLTINEHYAKAYAHRKEREELQKRAHLTTLTFNLTVLAAEVSNILQSRTSTDLTRNSRMKKRRTRRISSLRMKMAKNLRLR